MSKVILVRMELAHEHDVEVEMIADAMRYWVGTWRLSLDSFSVEVVNEDPA